MQEKEGIRGTSGTHTRVTCGVVFYFAFHLFFIIHSSPCPSFKPRHEPFTSVQRRWYTRAAERTAAAFLNGGGSFLSKSNLSDEEEKERGRIRGEKRERGQRQEFT